MMNPNSPKLRSFLSLLSALFLFAALSAQEVPCAGEPECPYPALPGTGAYLRVTNGGIEEGSGTRATRWTPENSRSAALERSDVDPIFEGFSFSLRGDFSNPGGPGIAQDHDSIPVTPGETYMLSGFVRNGIVGGGAAYLDLNDVSFERQAGSTSGAGVVEFVCAEFTVPDGVNSITVRTVTDGKIEVGSSAQFDEVAVTPIDDFERPPALR